MKGWPSTRRKGGSNWPLKSLVDLANLLPAHPVMTTMIPPGKTTTTTTDFIPYHLLFFIPRNYQSYSRYRRRKKRDGATPPSSSNNSTSQLAPLADPQPPVVRRSSSLRQTRTFAHESQTLPVRDNSSPEHIYHEIGEVGCGLQLNGPRGTSASDHFSASAKLQPRYVSREHIVIKSEEVRQTSPDDSKLRATPPIPAPRRRDVNKGRKGKQVMKLSCKKTNMDWVLIADPTKEREALSMVEPSKVSLFGLEERQFQPIKASSLQGLSGSSRNSFRDSSSPGGGSESLLSHHRSSPSYLRKALEGNSSSKAPIAPTSYSSEEILFQAASDLQGLNGKCFIQSDVLDLALLCSPIFLLPFLRSSQNKETV